jgi:4-amino-4-deoxy-L-arabinose transferase-like glycosyltransferase
MGSPGSVPLDDTLGHRTTVAIGSQLPERPVNSKSYFLAQLTILAVAAAIFLGCIASPPSLMDDVDAVQAQIARNMLGSGDWVTPHLAGVAYLEKPPLKYWLIAIAFKLFGVRDWAARLPVALSAVLLCWLVFRIGVWAFSARAGTYAGLAIATSIGVFLFTRVQLSEVMIAFTIALAMWAFLRVLDDTESHRALWSVTMAAAIGVGLLLKGLIAAVFPVAAALLYLAFTRQLFLRQTWRLLHPFRGLLIVLAIAAPWHVLATLRNPPYFDLTTHSGPGQYHGFFWFYFVNEHVLRFLNLRYPHDYNTVPRVWFWLFHLLWLFPFSLFFPAVATLSFKPPWPDAPSDLPSDAIASAAARASRMRLLCLCWVGFMLVFFTFSSTQEYYSLPCYPALALLLGSALTNENLRTRQWVRVGMIALAAVATLAAAAIAFILAKVWNLPAPGDISRALVAQDPSAYTLSLAHMGDLTLASFAYLRTPLAVAGIAFVIGAAAAWLGRKLDVKIAGVVVMMVLFFHAARLALVIFDPYLSSRPLAEALNRAPHGKLILDDQYYTFSSVVFYAEAYRGERILLLNGRVNNLEYGSYAPGAPRDVFIDDADFQRRWVSSDLYYICVEKPQVARLEKLAGPVGLHVLVESGGKFVFANQPTTPIVTEARPCGAGSLAGEPGFQAGFIYNARAVRAVVPAHHCEARP